MDIKVIFAVIAGTLGIIGYIPYIRDILKGTTKPHSYTFLIWSITMGTAVAGTLYGGGGAGGFSMIIGTIAVFGIFLLSLRYGTKNITLADTTILAIAFLAIFIWWWLRQPLISILMVSAIDFLGYIPSFRKSYQEPWSETVFSWILFVISNIFVVAALTQYNFLTLTYIVTITIANIMIVFICVLRRPLIAQPA